MNDNSCRKSDCHNKKVVKDGLCYSHWHEERERERTIIRLAKQLEAAQRGQARVDLRQEV